jgi:geranylgeranyl diphosphate synthase, type II
MGIRDTAAAIDSSLVDRVLSEARSDVRLELQRVLAERRRTGYGPLYDLLADYPFREGKGLRPAICLAACRAAGGVTTQALLSAAALELFHNGFLIHDDIEDSSRFRRGDATLFEAHGVPIAINVGDATNVVALEMLLGNTTTIGVRKALLVLREVERMARESVEGQAIELDWIKDDRFDLDDRDYVRMAYKKTCWYTVIAPLRIGVICGSAAGRLAPIEEMLAPLIELGFRAGIAFQIHDDLLNLEGDETQYGKEVRGDLWEGKRTVMLLHFLRSGGKLNRDRAIRLLRQPRNRKDHSEVAWLGDAMMEAGSFDHGRTMAKRYSEMAIDLDAAGFPFLEENQDRYFLREMLQYVVERVR